MTISDHHTEPDDYPWPSEPDYIDDTEQIVRGLLEPNLAVDCLADVLADGYEPERPTMLHGADLPGLFYPGRSHDLHGEPSAGKTWLACHAGAQLLTETTDGMLFVDYEDTPYTFAMRMLALGVPPDVVADPTRVQYVRPTGPQGTAERDILLDLAHRTTCGLVVIDAMVGALATDGLNENDNSDVARWIDRSVKPYLLAGAAVVVLDHVAGNPEGRKRGARGATAKLGAISGASYLVEVAIPYDRRTRGQLRVRIAKDRHGMVGPIGHVAALVDIEPHDEGRTVTMTARRPPSATDDHGHFLPTIIMERVSQHFERLSDPGRGQSLRTLQKEVSGKDSVVRTAVDRLCEYGHLRAEANAGKGGGTHYFLMEPYVAPAEDAHPGTEPDGHIDVAAADQADVLDPRDDLWAAQHEPEMLPDFDRYDQPRPTAANRGPAAEAETVQLTQAGTQWASTPTLAPEGGQGRPTAAPQVAGQTAERTNPQPRPTTRPATPTNHDYDLGTY